MALADTSDAALEGLMLGGISAIIFSTSNFIRKWLGVCPTKLVAQSLVEVVVVLEDVRRGVSSSSILLGFMLTLGVVAVVASTALVAVGEGFPRPTAEIDKSM
eukprot:3625697-Amphidinium_carterae.2